MYQYSIYRKQLGFILIAIFITFWGSITITEAQDCTVTSGEPIQVGVVMPEGNLLSVALSEPLQGVQALVEAVNACGGVDGRPIDLVHIPANDRDDAEAAVNELREMGISVVIGSGSLAVSEILWEQEDLIIWEVTESLTTDNQWVFSPRPTNYQLGLAAAEYVETTIRAELGKEDLRIALVYEDRPRAQQIAEGIRDGLSEAPIMEGGEGYISDDAIRDQNIDVVMVATFDRQADWLWSGLRYENANIAAWVQVGNENNSRNLCQRYGNTDGLISVNPSGHISRQFRDEVTDGLYSLYYEMYRETNDDTPTARAELAASGSYVLLRNILPQVDDFSAGGIRSVIETVNISEAVGFMGEGFAADVETGRNIYAQSIIRQRQMGMFCTISPSGGSTCDDPFVEFPTWRERALMEEQFVCRDSV